MTWELPIRGFYSPSIELFGGDNFLQWINQGPKNTADKRFSLWHSLSRDMHMFARIYLELPQIHFQGRSPNRHFKSILLQFVSKIIDIFVLITPGRRICSSQGSPIRQILQLSLGSSSFCLACGSINLSISHATHNKCLIVPISILNGNLGYQSYRQHIIWSMVLWFEGLSKY